ncbi:hypothetical protein EDB89DRAFT_1507786 [Lactarius sanguifluus]|nr:hypothetical protein EDB89DRAFT_1507786 [Lactarius sanguifluus]
MPRTTCLRRPSPRSSSVRGRGAGAGAGSLGQVAECTTATTFPYLDIFVELHCEQRYDDTVNSMRASRNRLLDLGAAAPATPTLHWHQKAFLTTESFVRENPGRLACCSLRCTSRRVPQRGQLGVITLSLPAQQTQNQQQYFRDSVDIDGTARRTSKQDQS